MTENQKIILQKIGERKNIVKIRFLEVLNNRVLHLYLAAALNKCFKNKYYKIILDMTNIDEPSHQFIGTLIEATAKVRTKNGDVKIINASDQAKQILSSFNSYSYLNIADKNQKDKKNKKRVP